MKGERNRSARRSGCESRHRTECSTCAAYTASADIQPAMPGLRGAQAIEAAEVKKSE